MLLTKGLNRKIRPSLCTEVISMGRAMRKRVFGYMRSLIRALLVRKQNYLILQNVSVESEYPDKTLFAHVHDG